MSPERLRWGVLAALVIALGFVLGRAFNPVPHSGGDNSGYVTLAHTLLTEGAYTETFDPEAGPHTKYPPVFPAVLALLIALGARGWVALKSVSFVATLVAVGATFLWAERRVGLWGAASIAALVGLSSAVVYYSHWILSDPLFVALTVVGWLCLERAGLGGAPETEERGGVAADRAGVVWLGAGIVAAGLAFFTRSAGLPLVLALFGALALHRRWKALAVAGTAIGLPALGWWLRGRGVGVAAYGSEFWLVDPYQPTLGTIGPLGLFPRLLENLEAYVFQHGPAGIVGSGFSALAALGVVLTIAALAGWVLSLRERVGVAELFFPLYAGLILLWPAVWAGDRFVLPLYPLIFLYGAVSLRALTDRFAPKALPALAAVVTLALLAPALGTWMERADEASLCGSVARQGGSWACYGDGVRTFAEAATWSGSMLPEGSVVLSRKPRHFYLLSGIPSRTFPFDPNPQAHLDLADALGARYVLLDQWDGQAGRFVGAAVTARPGAYCFVQLFGSGQGARAQLLGILPSTDRVEVEREGPPQIGRCPSDYVRSGSSSTSSGRDGIPLLEGLDS